MLGSTTRYRVDTDGSMIFRIDAVVPDTSLCDVLACWREPALYPEWMPCCTHSKLLTAFRGRADLLIQLNMLFGGLFSRDAVVRGYGVDALEAAGKILFIGRSVDQAELPDARVPQPDRGVTRMLFKRLQCSLEPIDATTTHATLLMTIDPRIDAIPYAMLQGFIRRTLCLFFWQLRRCAGGISSARGPHAEAVAADAAFYRGWLEPKVEAYLDKLRCK